MTDFEIQDIVDRAKQFEGTPEEAMKKLKRAFGIRSNKTGRVYLLQSGRHSRAMVLKTLKPRVY